MVSPIKPLEAFSAGRVVLMSDVAPQHDLADGGKTAPLFRSDDLSSLTAELKRLLEDADVRRGYERRGRLWVNDHRTWRAVCASLLMAHESARDNHENALEAIERIPSVSRLTAAVAGRIPAGLSLQETCQLQTLAPDRAQWLTTLRDAKIDLVVTDADDPESWDVETLSDLFQDAAAEKIPSMVISDVPVGPGTQVGKALPFCGPHSDQGRSISGRVRLRGTLHNRIHSPCRNRSESNVAPKHRGTQRRDCGTCGLNPLGTGSRCRTCTPPSPTHDPGLANETPIPFHQRRERARRPR